MINKYIVFYFTHVLHVIWANGPIAAIGCLNTVYHVLRHNCGKNRLGVAGDISDIGDMHFDSIDTEIKKYFSNNYMKTGLD